MSWVSKGALGAHYIRIWEAPEYFCGSVCNGQMQSEGGRDVVHFLQS